MRGPNPVAPRNATAHGALRNLQPLMADLFSPCPGVPFTSPACPTRDCIVHVAVLWHQAAARTSVPCTLHPASEQRAARCSRALHFTSLRHAGTCTCTQHDTACCLPGALSVQLVLLQLGHRHPEFTQQLNLCGRSKSPARGTEPRPCS